MNYALRLTLLLLSFCTLACKQHAIPEVGTIETIDPRLADLIDTTARIEIIAEGFEWSEGPLWVESQEMLLFSDVPKNIVYKWTEANGKEIYLKPPLYATLPIFRRRGSNG